MEVLRASDPFNSGSDISLSQAVDDASARVDIQLADRPDLASQVRFALGYSMISRNRLGAAERELTRALRESRQAFGEEAPQTPRVREGIAQLSKVPDRPVEGYYTRQGHC